MIRPTRSTSPKLFVMGVVGLLSFVVELGETYILYNVTVTDFASAESGTSTYRWTGYRFTLNSEVNITGLRGGFIVDADDDHKFQTALFRLNQDGDQIEEVLAVVQSVRDLRAGYVPLDEPIQLLDKNYSYYLAQGRNDEEADGDSHGYYRASNYETADLLSALPFLATWEPSGGTHSLQVGGSNGLSSHSAYQLINEDITNTFVFKPDIGFIAFAMGIRKPTVSATLTPTMSVTPTISTSTPSIGSPTPTPSVSPPSVSQIPKSVIRTELPVQRPRRAVV